MSQGAPERVLQIRGALHSKASNADSFRNFREVHPRYVDSKVFIARPRAFRVSPWPGCCRCRRRGGPGECLLSMGECSETTKLVLPAGVIRARATPKFGRAALRPSIAPVSKTVNVIISHFYIYVRRNAVYCCDFSFLNPHGNFRHIVLTFGDCSQAIRGALPSSRRWPKS